MCSLFDKEKHSLDARGYLTLPEGTMLADYYERVVGTPEPQGYEELVLYACSDTHVRLEHYTDGDTEAEQMTARLLPAAALQEVYDAIAASGMDRWSERDDLVGICGKVYVCKFPDGKDGFVRVSSDEMPADGTAAFRAVKSAFFRCLGADGAARQQAHPSE